MLLCEITQIVWILPYCTPPIVKYPVRLNAEVQSEQSRSFYAHRLPAHKLTVFKM